MKEKFYKGEEFKEKMRVAFHLWVHFPEKLLPQMLHKHMDTYRNMYYLLVPELVKMFWFSESLSEISRWQITFLMK